MSVTGPYGFEFARIAVPDLEASTAFYEYHVGLTVSEPTDDCVYLRAGIEHHSLELVPEPGLETAEVRGFGFSVESPQVLGEIRDRVQAAGCEILPLDGRLKGLCEEGFGFRDPEGMTVELFTDFYEFAELPLVELRPLMIVHPFVGTSRWEEMVRFYMEVVGFRASDYIGHSTAFLRSENRYHHSFAIRRQQDYEVAHICFMMKSFDHVMRARAQARYREVPIAADLVNHSASRSLAFYMLDPRHGPRIELCDGHTRLSEEQHETHRPRRMSVDPRNIDVWRAASDDWGDL